MNGKVRIEYPGAFYHVYDRGVEKRDIFLDEQDKNYFLKICEELYKSEGLIAHSYCLMSNHFHFFLETPFGNLSKILHRLKTKYAIYFNLKYERCGHLFQNRFQAKLVETEIYANVLAKYIHLNPIEAGLVEDPADWQWSSYPSYLGQTKKRNFLHTDLVLNMANQNKKEQLNSLESYTNDSEKIDIDSLVIDSCFLGTKAFAKELKLKYLGEEENSPIHFTLSKDEKINKVKSLIKPLKITYKLKRKLLMFGLKRTTGLSLIEIGAEVDIRSPKAVSKQISRLEKEAELDDDLRELLDIFN